MTVAHLALIGALYFAGAKPPQLGPGRPLWRRGIRGAAARDHSAAGGRSRRRLRQAIEGADYGHAGRITASFGVAELADDGSPAELVRSADRAMYEAKAQGRNRVVLSGKSRHSLPL